MKILLLASLLIMSNFSLTAQENNKVKIQGDLNFAAIGLKAQIESGKGFELDAGLGYGISIVNSVNVKKYQMIEQIGRGGDAWLPEFYHGFYAKAGGLYKYYTSSKAKPLNAYVKMQYTGYFESRNLARDSEPHLKYQNRLAAKAGLRKALNAKQTCTFSFELGAALWANQNFSFVSGGPQLNFNLVKDIFVFR